MRGCYKTVHIYFVNEEIISISFVNSSKAAPLHTRESS